MTIAPGLRVRRASLEDVDSLVALRVAMFDELGQRSDGVSKGRFPRLPSPQIAGTSEGYILNIYTKPAWRGKGGASALLAAAEAEARRRGLARIRLHTSPLGRPVYERAGYQARTDEMELVLTASSSE